MSDLSREPRGPLEEKWRWRLDFVDGNSTTIEAKESFLREHMTQGDWFSLGAGQHRRLINGVYVMTASVVGMPGEVEF